MSVVAGWDGSFFRKSALFWPIARAAEKLESFADWPAPEDLARAFADLPVRFERAAPRPRRAPSSMLARYDERIAIDRVVPTRERSWHDLTNALVWATFPRAKLALHTRQHRMISARVGPDRKLPSTRTKEQDAVAMLDEGGVALLCPSGRREDACAIVFGHAIFEELASGQFERVRAAVYKIDVARVEPSYEASIAIADLALAELLAREAILGHEDFESIVVDEDLGRKNHLPATTRASSAV